MRAGNDEGPVTVEVDCTNGFGMGRQILEEFAVFDVPDTDTFVHGAAGEEVTCGVEAETKDIVCMTSQNLYAFRLGKMSAVGLERGITVLTFHNRTVLSSEPDASSSLVGDQAISLIPFVCPW
jgi:hypothetical protein